MQWNNETYGGFSTIKPWIRVNENHQHINVKQSLEDENSILDYYKKLIRMRNDSNTSSILVEGKYRTILEHDEQIFAYERYNMDRVMTVICNFFEYEKAIVMPKQINGDVILTNYAKSKIFGNVIHLRPYETIVFW